MYEVTCYDLKGNTINNFFQWDVDQNVVIKLKGCDPNLLTISPEAHFSNTSRSEALVTRATVNGEKDTITATVPNILLQEPYPLLVYIYLTDAQDVSSQKTILYSEIPVRKRAKPSDYLYVENITRITADDIKKEIEASVADTKTSAISSINTTKTSAINTVNGLVTTATNIKNDTQAVYNNTVSVANSTKTTIENSINTKISDGSLELKTRNNNGDVTLSIIIS